MSVVDPQTAQTLFDQGHISQDLFNQITDPTQINLDSVPVATAEDKDKWARDNTEAQVQDALAQKYSSNPKFEVPPLSQAQAQEREIEAAQNLPVKTSTPDPSVTEKLKSVENEMKRKEAGLPYDQKILDSVPRETLSPGQGTGDVSTQPTTKAAPSALESLYSDFGREKQANTEAAKIGQEEAEKQAAYQTTLVQKQQDLLQAEQAREVERQKQLNHQNDLLQEKLNTFQKSPANVSQAFAQKSTGGKILAGIALFLGAAPNGTAQNSAVQTMQAAIDADLNKQKAGITGQQGIYNQLRETFGDERQAESGARIAYLQNAQLQLNQIASQYKSEQVAANTKLANITIDKQIDTLKAEFQQAALARQGIAQADQVTQGIYKMVPKDLQEKAIAEKGTLDDLEKSKKTVGDAFDKLYDSNVISANIPFTKKKAEDEAAQAAIWTNVMKFFNARAINNPEILKKAKALLPVPSDTKDQVTAKKVQLNALLENLSPETPILSGFGIKPKTVAQQLPGLKKL